LPSPSAPEHISDGLSYLQAISSASPPTRDLSWLAYPLAE
jgi:hypothetical protein